MKNTTKCILPQIPSTLIRLANPKPAATVGHFVSVKISPGVHHLCVIKEIAGDQRHLKVKRVE